MSTMKELVPEYREAAAKLAMRIAEKKSAGVPGCELLPLQEALRDIREAQRLMDGYYDVPRTGPFSLAGMKVRNASNES